VCDALPMGVQRDKHRKKLSYLSSLANAFLHMQLAATTFGLGAQWYSAVQTPYSACLIKDFFGIPAEFDVYDMRVLGYPAIKPTKKFSGGFQKSSIGALIILENFEMMKMSVTLLNVLGHGLLVCMPRSRNLDIIWEIAKGSNSVFSVFFKTQQVHAHGSE